MPSRINSKQLKLFLVMQSMFVLPLLTPQIASAAVAIKSTNYPIPNNAYFVSPNGNNNNSGKSKDSPWTVEKAIASAPNGATIVFLDGTYRNVSANINKKLTLQAFPNSKPLLKGSEVVGGWVADGRSWRKDGWNHSFGSNGMTTSADIDSKYPMAGYRDMVYIDGNSLQQVSSKAAVAPGKFYVDYRSNKLYIGSNPANKTVEATTREDAFNLSNKSATGAAIRGLGFAHYAQYGIGVIGTPRVTIENSTFVWNGLVGVLLRKAENAILRGNTFSYNAMNGVRGNEANNVLLENNTISYNNIENFRKNWSGAGMKVVNTRGAVWRNNLFEHNIGNGIWTDTSTYNSTIQNNTIRSNEQIGVMLELSHKAIVSGNTITNSPCGLMVADTSSVHAYNNRISGNKKNIIVKDSPRVNKNKAEIALGITWITRNNVIQNN